MTLNHFIHLLPASPDYLPSNSQTHQTSSSGPVDLLREPLIGQLDPLRIGHLVAVALFLGSGARDGEGAGGGRSRGVDTIGDGLGAASVAGCGAGATAEAREVQRGRSG